MLYQPQTIFTRTTKGVREARSTRLPRELSRVFAAEDGKGTVAELVSKSGVAEGHCHIALEQLVTEGYIRIFSGPDLPIGQEPSFVTQPIPTAGIIRAASDDGDELDFTSAEGVA